MAIKLEINLTNKWLYSLIAIGFLLAFTVGVYAYQSNMLAGDPLIMGHSAGEIDVRDANGNIVGLQEVLDDLYQSAFSIDYNDCIFDSSLDTALDKPLTEEFLTQCPQGYVMVGLAGGYGHSSTYNLPHRLKCCKLV